VANQDTTSRQLGAMRAEIIALQQELMHYRMVPFFLVEKNELYIHLGCGSRMLSSVPQTAFYSYK